jgi:Flp pilus assembly protein TadD
MKLIKKAIKLADDKIKNKEYNDAELICEQVIKVDPKNLDALYLLSISKYKLQKKQEFKECFDKILELTPNDFSANNSLGISYLHLGDLSKSIEYFKKATKIEPKNALGWSNLGCQLRAQKKYYEAVRCLKKSNKLSNEKDPQILVNLAGAWAESLNIKESIRCLRKAIKINPNLHSAHVDLGCAYFLNNEYKKAWKHYQHRFNHFDYLKCKVKNFNKNKKWNGKKIKDGKKILFFCEQGIGDSINFIRFIKDFQIRFPSVIVKVLVPTCLYELFSKNFEGIIKNIEDHDYWCSIMDIPYLLKMSAEDIKKTYKPYIKETKKCDYSKFDNLYKIGICWAGNPQHPKDDDRSCYLYYFQVLYYSGPYCQDNFC